MTLSLDPPTLLAAMRADCIPEGSSGLWWIRKQEFLLPTPAVYQGQGRIQPAGLYTYLHRLTDSTIYQQPPGEIVMEDSPFELRTHLGFVLHAYGRVLVTGLGLGCVVRGLLAGPRVDHVTCIENSPDVLRLVGPYMPTERLTIVEADAFQWVAASQAHFDCAWHDLWTDRDAGEPLLDFWHVALLMNCRRLVDWQGAWSLDRTVKRRMVEKYGFHWMG